MFAIINTYGYGSSPRLRFIDQPENAPANRAERRRTRYVTVAEVADFLGVTPRSVRNYISAGLFPAYRIPGTRGVRLNLDEVNQKMRAVPATVARTGAGSFGPKATIIDLPRQPLRVEAYVEPTNGGES